MKMRSWGWTRSFALGLALAGGASHLYAGGPSVPGKPATTTKSVSHESNSWAAPVMYQDPGMMQPPGMMAPPGMMPPPGMMQPGMMPPPGMMQPGMMPPGMMPNMHQAGYTGMPYGPGMPLPADGQDMVFPGPAPAGLEGECDSVFGGGGCGNGSCGGGCGGSCGGGILGGGGLFGGGGGCPSCGGMGGDCGQCGPVRRILACGPFGGALACRNGSCGFERGVLPGLCGLLLPYGEGGVCAQRWYDFSVGGMALKRTKQGGQNIDLASQGIGGPIILSTDDEADNSC